MPYLFLTAGAGAAMFHLVTHAFFKALLFLGSGSVIHGCHHEQDIFKMGGLAKKMPITFITFTLGVLAIIGFPFLAGFYSKDAILLLAMQKSAPVLGILAFSAILTAFYMVRMWKLVFFGSTRSDNAAHADESGFSMTIPLFVLGVLAVAGGWAGVYGKLAGEVAYYLPASEELHTRVLIVSVIVMVLGGGAAWLFYKPSDMDTLEQKSTGLFNGLTALKESFDVIYGYYVAKVQQRFAMLLNFLEQIFLAGLIIRGFSGFVGLLGLGARALHTGSLHAYVYWFLLGVVLLWALITGMF